MNVAWKEGLSQVLAIHCFPLLWSPSFIFTILWQVEQTAEQCHSKGFPCITRAISGAKPILVQYKRRWLWLVAFRGVILISRWLQVNLHILYKAHRPVFPPKFYRSFPIFQCIYLDLPWQYRSAALSYVAVWRSSKVNLIPVGLYHNASSTPMTFRLHAGPDVFDHDRSPRSRPNELWPDQKPCWGHHKGWSVHDLRTRHAPFGRASWNTIPPRERSVLVGIFTRDPCSLPELYSCSPRVCNGIKHAIL